MTFVVRFSPAAESEFIEAGAWYEARSAGLGAAFARAVADAEALLLRDPLRFPVLFTSRRGMPVRRVLLRRFPYSLHYLVEADRVWVLACMHARRDPKRWRTD